MVRDPILNIGEAGLQTTDEQVKSLMNRMVNAETPGFKSSDILVRSFPVILENELNKINAAEEPRVESTYYDYTAGTLMRTGNPTDLALGAEGYFVIQCPWGEGYTRDGRFTLNPDGLLVSTVGQYPLLGANGPITITPGETPEITQNGEVKVGAALVDTIRVVTFDNPQELVPVNGSIFQDSEKGLWQTEVEAPRVIQGFVEGSNANVVNQMIDLMTIQRVYNMDTKIVSNREANLSKLFQMGSNQ